MKQYKKEDAEKLFPDNKEAQAKFKSMVQGCIIANKKALEAESDEALKEMVMAKCVPSVRRAFRNRIMKVANDAKKYISEDEIVKAIEDAYKVKANADKQRKIDELEKKLQALRDSLK